MIIATLNHTINPQHHAKNNHHFSRYHIGNPDRSNHFQQSPREKRPNKVPFQVRPHPNTMKKIFLFITSLFAVNGITSMDSRTRISLKAAAFDSYDDDSDENYDDTYDDTFDSVDEFKGKSKSKGGSVNTGWIATSGYFTVQVVNAMGAPQRIELFSSLRNAAFVQNTTLYPTYLPFTFSNRAAANANSTVVFAANGDCIITTGAGAILTISCKQIPYRTLLESLKFYRISVKQTKMTFTNEPQLDNDITHITQTLLGKKEENTFTPRVYFKDNQFQSKQVTIPQAYIIDGERGLQLDVASGETMSFNFYLNGIQKA